VVRRQERPTDAGPLVEVRQGLHRLQRLLAGRRSAASLVAAAGVDLTQQGVQVLNALRDGGPCSPADIARVAQMDAAAVSRQVRTLEADGLVERRPSPGHGRIVLVALSRRGVQVADELAEIRERHLTEVLRGWSSEEQAQLGHLLLRLVDDLQETPYRRS
jgi:DNA-binding MarR family transcriptional regulator